MTAIENSESTIQVFLSASSEVPMPDQQSFSENSDPGSVYSFTSRVVAAKKCYIVAVSNSSDSESSSRTQHSF